MQHRLRRRFAGALLTAGVALATGLLATPSTAAAPSAPTAPTSKIKAPGYQLAPRSVGTQASGGRSRDITLSGPADITARNASNGRLVVYPHSGTLSGTSTFQAGVATSSGWGGMNWIAPAEANGSIGPDILARTSDGRLFAYPHSGTFGPTGTFLAGVFLGYGWNAHDLLFPDDWNGDGFDDLLARPRNSDQILLYMHSGTLSGTSTYQPPVVVIGSGAFFDTWEAMTDVTGDGVTDLIFRVTTGELGVFDFTANPQPPPDPPLGETYLLGYGWNINDQLLINDVDNDGFDDIVARRASNGNLYAYRHRGTWDVNNTTATFQAPVLLGFGWRINDIIT